MATLSETTSLDTSWMAKGACRRHDPEIFFPDLNGGDLNGGDLSGGGPEQAKRICRHCPVQGICLGYALRTRQRHGIWGGMTARQRARYLTRERKAA